jgi:hypothetical protein
MAAILEKISPRNAALAVWGFKNPVNASEVKAAVKTLANSVKGAGHHFIIMTGTHGVCNPPGLVGTQEIRFAEQDVARLREIKTKDGEPVTIQIWPVNPKVNKPKNLQEAGELTAFLNQSLRAIGEEVAERGTQAKTLVLLAYCCSAGQ